MPKAITIAGTRIVVPDMAVIFDMDERRPVYHRASYTTNLDGTYRRYTTCGRTIVEITEGETLIHAQEIPTRHARRFARPCRRCWPMLRGQAILEIKEGRL